MFGGTEEKLRFLKLSVCRQRFERPLLDLKRYGSAAAAGAKVATAIFSVRARLRLSLGPELF
jgi:hypothetical protein